MSDKKQAEFLTLGLSDKEIDDAFYSAVRAGAAEKDVRMLGNRLMDLDSIADTVESQLKVLTSLMDEHRAEGDATWDVRRTVRYWAAVGFLVAIAHAFEAGLIAGKRRWDKEAAA